MAMAVAIMPCQFVCVGQVFGCQSIDGILEVLDNSRFKLNCGQRARAANDAGSGLAIFNA